jgi:hypothetical protein
MLHKYEFILDSGGFITIWDMPEPDTRYTLGIDTSTGVSTDWTVGCVLSNRMPFTQVAMFRAKCSVVEAARMLVELGYFYNGAMAVIETNGIGFAMQDAFIVQHRYPFNYQFEQHADEAPEISSKYGVAMKDTVKWLLVRETKQLLEDPRGPQLIIRDRTTVEEMCNFVYKEDRCKCGAAEGANDDCVMALMLAVHGASQYPQAPRPKPKPTMTAQRAQHAELVNRLKRRIIAMRQGKLVGEIM